MKRPKPKSKPTEAPMPVSKPAEWHKLVASIAGELSLAVIKRKMNRQDLLRWAGVLSTVAGEMDDTAAGPR
jgi:hypothetical protein